MNKPKEEIKSKIKVKKKRKITKTPLYLATSKKNLAKGRFASIKASLVQLVADLELEDDYINSQVRNINEQIDHIHRMVDITLDYRIKEEKINRGIEI